MSVKIRVTADDGKRFFVDTGMTTMYRFSSREFPKQEKHCSAKTSRLNIIYDKVEEFALRNPNMGSAELAESLRTIVGGKDPLTRRLWEYILDYMDRARTESTMESLRSTANKVQQFDGKATLDINASWLESFDRWMEKNGNGVNGRGVHMRNLRAVINWCIDNEWTDKYPFRRFKIKKEETRKRALSLKKLRELRDYPLEGRQAMYRDLFMLSFYLCGANSVDLLTHPPLHGRRFEGRRKKTGQRYDIPVTKEIMDIINRWKGKDYMLCPMDTNKSVKAFRRNWNEGLQNIGREYKPHFGYMVDAEDAPFAGITTYWARHTWATMAAKLDIPKEVIAKCLTHSWASTVTDTYIEFDYSKVDEAVRKVIKYVKSGA